MPDGEGAPVRWDVAAWARMLREGELTVAGFYARVKVWESQVGCYAHRVSPKAVRLILV